MVSQIPPGISFSFLLNQQARPILVLLFCALGWKFTGKSWFPQWVGSPHHGGWCGSWALGWDYLMGVNEGLQGLCVVRKCSPKAKCLLCFRKPLQQHVDCVPKLFCLK